MVTEPEQPFVVQPRLGPFAAKMLGALIAAAIPIGFIAFGERDPGGLIILAVLLVALPLAIGLQFIYLRTARMLLTTTHITKERWGFRRTVLIRADVHGLMAPLIIPGSPQLFPVLVLRERTGRRRRIKISGWQWPHDQLRLIAEELGIEEIEEPLKGRQFDAIAPGVLAFWDRRPMVWAFLIVFAAIPLILAVVLGLAMIYGG